MRAGPDQHVRSGERALREHVPGSSDEHPGRLKRPDDTWDSQKTRDGPGRTHAQRYGGPEQVMRTPAAGEVGTRELHLQEQTALL